MNGDLELERLFRNYLQKCESTSLLVVLISLIVRTLEAQNTSVNFELHVLKNFYLKPDLFLKPRRSDVRSRNGNLMNYLVKLAAQYNI